MVDRLLSVFLVVENLYSGEKKKTRPNYIYHSQSVSTQTACYHAFISTPLK